MSTATAIILPWAASWAALATACGNEKRYLLKKQSDKVVKNHEKAADDVADAWKDAGKDAIKRCKKEFKVKTCEIVLEGMAEGEVK